MYINILSENSIPAEKAMGKTETMGYGIRFNFSEEPIKNTKIENYGCSTDEGIKAMVYALFPKTYGHVYRVKNGVIYTNKPGLVIGKKGSNIKFISSQAGRRVKVEDYVETEKELISLLSSKFSERNKKRVFNVAIANGYKNALKELAENPNTKIHLGDQYEDEAEDGKDIGYILKSMGYKVPGKFVCNSDWGYDCLSVVEEKNKALVAKKLGLKSS